LFFSCTLLTDVRICLENIEALLQKKRKKSCMKVIGFRPKNGFAPVMEKFERAVVSLGISRTDLAMEAFGAGLEPAIRTLAERRRREAVDTLKRLKIAKVSVFRRITTDWRRRKMPADSLACPPCPVARCQQFFLALFFTARNPARK
jgi:hypothetical protein